MMQDRKKILHGFDVFFFIKNLVESNLLINNCLLLVKIIKK